MSSDDDTLTESGAADATEPTWAVGNRVLGQYELLAVHQGGMGVVYRARHSTWGAEVAIKRPRPELLGTETRRQRFVREARTWIDFGQHPNVCNCYYVRNVDGVPAVFAEYVRGGSLAGWIGSGRLYEGTAREVVARILDIAIQAAWGLEYAHSLGVLHRDVKPANILISDDEAAKVTDFGLSGARAPSEGPIGAYRGTLRYASPEQLMGGSQDESSDVWSFAVSVLEMVTGHATWMAGSAAGAALAQAHAAQPLHELPAGLTTLLSECFALAPADRPHGMDEVCRRLVEVYEATLSEVYPRSRPAREGPRGDELNNRALSLLDLGHEDAAEQVFREALEADPRHPEATFNLGMLRWRAGDITDSAVLDALEEAQRDQAETGRVSGLKSLVDVERARISPGFSIDIPHGGVGTGPICVAPGGEHVLVEGGGAVHVIELPTGRYVHRLDCKSDFVTAIGVDRRGSYALTAGAEGTIRLWDLQSGRCLRRRRRRVGFDGAMVCLAPDGKLALVNQIFRRRSRVEVWSMDGRRRPWSFYARDDVTSMCATPDGRRALVADGSGAVEVWDLTARRRSFFVELSDSPVRSMVIDATGRRAITVGADGPVHGSCVWDLTTGRCSQILPDSGGPIRITPDGRLGLTGGVDGVVRMWDLSNGECIRELKGHTGAVMSINISGNDPQVAATLELGGAVRVWDTRSGRCLRTTTDAVRGKEVAVTPDGKTIVYKTESTVRSWNVAPSRTAPLQICRSRTADELAERRERVERLLRSADDATMRCDFQGALKVLRSARQTPGYERSPEIMDVWHRTIRSAGPVRFRAAWGGGMLKGAPPGMTDLCATPDGNSVLACGSPDGAVCVIGLDGVSDVERLEGHDGTVRSIYVDPAGKFALTGSDDGTARLWGLASWESLGAFNATGAPIISVCATPNGSRVVAGCADGSVHVWDNPSGKLRWRLEGHLGAVIGAATTVDGRFAFTAGRVDNSVRQWDLSTGKLSSIPEAYSEGQISSMCLTAQGWLVTCHGLSGAVRVRELGVERSLHEFEHGLGAVVHAVRASSDGMFAVVAHSHGVTLWDLARGKKLGELERLAGRVDAIGISPDDREIYTGNNDGAIQRWTVEWELQSDPAGGA